jgi:hypothetical protein
MFTKDEMAYAYGVAMRITKEDIADIRGATPVRCDFCQCLRNFEELEPEEAGDWVCHDCLRKWLKQDVQQIKTILALLYNDLEAAKWWFTPQAYLAGRTPHEMILSDASSVLLLQLTKFADGGYA